MVRKCREKVVHRDERDKTFTKVFGRHKKETNVGINSYSVALYKCIYEATQCV